MQRRGAGGGRGHGSGWSEARRENVGRGRARWIKKNSDMWSPRLVVGIEDDILRMTGAGKLNADERILMIRQEYSF